MNITPYLSKIRRGSSPAREMDDQRPNEPDRRRPERSKVHHHNEAAVKEDRPEKTGEDHQKENNND